MIPVNEPLLEKEDFDLLEDPLKQDGFHLQENMLNNLSMIASYCGCRRNFV